MSGLLVSSGPPDGKGTTLTVTPASAGWSYVGFSVVRLAAGETRSFLEEGRELCVVVLAGRVSAEAGELLAPSLGGRKSVFDGPPCALYAPAGVECRVRALDGGAELALCSAPGTGDSAFSPAAIEDVVVETRGEGSAQRTVHPILMDDRPAESLLVVEVLTPAGNWSSFPPHRHEKDDLPRETLLEETYYHRLQPPEGFALQRVYTDERDLDETIAVGDRDLVLVPRGYHVVAAMPGYDLYYLNVMAGPRRQWRFRDDPAYEWLRNPGP